MSAGFASSLRARRAEIRLAREGEPAIRVRVQMPEVWDAVRIVASPSEPVITLKVKALDALFPAAELHEDFILKFRGWEILDEAMPLSDVGATDGSTLLLTHRRRRPVR